MLKKLILSIAVFIFLSICFYMAKLNTMHVAKYIVQSTGQTQKCIFLICNDFRGHTSKNVADTQKSLMHKPMQINVSSKTMRLQDIFYRNLDITNATNLSCKDSTTQRNCSGISSITATNSSVNISNGNLHPFPQSENIIKLKNAKPKIIYYLHIHKAGGSTMCAWAHKNNQRTPPQNCAINTMKSCCGGETILEQQKFALQTKYTFIANEHYMFSQMDMKYYDYVLTMRKSFSRYVSHYKHIARERHMKHNFESWLQGQPDNWTTRHLCGTPCKYKPKYSLTMQDVMLAYNKMRKFTDILFLETWRHDAMIFASKRKWSSGINIHANRAKRQYHNQSSNSLLMTIFDDIIYEHAFNKFEKDEKILQKNVSLALKKIQKMNFTFSSPCGDLCSEY